MNDSVISYKDGKAIPRAWTLEMIRSEIKRLDKITGLRGQDIPCVFNPKLHCALGRFWGGDRGATEKEMKFEFSKDFFACTSQSDNRHFSFDISETGKLDVVRHEYAHYYARVSFSYFGCHGAPWKRACGIVGCSPGIYYNPKAMIEKEQRNAPYVSKYCVGDSIYHQSFGTGTIQAIETYSNTAVLTVVFSNGICKKIDELWLIGATQRKKL